MFISHPNNNNIHSVSHCSEDFSSPVNFKRHLHENYELLLVISGDVNYNIDGHDYNLLPYDLIFIPSLSYHFVTPKSSDVYENYVINFDSNFFEEERLKSLFIHPYIRNISNSNKLRRMFSLFDFYYETYSTSDFEKASRYLLSEILLLSSYTPFDQEQIHLSSENSIIPTITSYISQNLESELNIDIIAHQLRFSKSYIKNCFSTVMGIGIQQYINQKKIHAAHADIQNGNEAIRIAEKYGFKDYSSFYRQYLKIIGVTPSKSKKLMS